MTPIQRSTKLIVENSHSAHVFYSVKNIFEDLVSKPIAGSFKSLDLAFANLLLTTLEDFYDLKDVRDVSSPDYRACGFQTLLMAQDYILMKHWQRMLNTLYAAGGKE